MSGQRGFSGSYGGDDTRLNGDTRLECRKFILGDEKGIGQYMSCSLYSPVFEFADQQMAVATAEAVMEGLMDRDNRQPPDMSGQRPRAEPGSTRPNTSAGHHGAQPPLDNPSDRLISRRDLLFGKISGTDE
ncbi:MAG: [NiFe]-hydrogenase assembly chaperone HybE [Gammaproteobacteria bacterium]|nr:[NiFe]-hydrogenase assembly chaperone HybE [Gammaproteobacteria bacterium]